MKTIRNIIAILFATFCTNIYCFGAYLTDIPMQITQPNGDTLMVYVSGDEYYNWMHDKDGYTIVQNTNGYYVYAQYNQKGNDIMASSYIVGKCNPQDVGLQPNITNRNVIMRNILNQKNSIIDESKGRGGYNPPTTGTINNIVIYIRFADQTEFTDSQSKYTNLFNNSTTGQSSVYNYFKEVSYNQLFVNSTFYPINNGSTIVSYQDVHNRNYYLPKTVSNSSGYTTDEIRRERESALLHNAINSIKNNISSTLNIDSNNDGYVDNICFIIRGGASGWDNLLWPHKGELFPLYSPEINGKMTYYYNFQIEDVITQRGVGVLSHEFCHSLGAPDLYHYDDGTYNGKPIGGWDIMGTTENPPQHINSYLKYFFHWITNVPEITSSGTYTLHPLTSSTNNCYKIAIKNKPKEFLLLEYRRNIGTFECSLPNSGLLIYRIDTSIRKIHIGNIFGKGYCTNEDVFYLYRLNGSATSNGDINSATFSANSERTMFSTKTNPFALLSDTTIANVQIKNVSSADNTITFDVVFCNGENIVYSNTSNIPSTTNAAKTIRTVGNVSIMNSNSVTFEAKESIELGKGFSIELGSSLVIDTNGCFEQ